MAVKKWYRPSRDQQWVYTEWQISLLDALISVNYMQFFNQLFVISMALIALAMHILIM
jgi:hypothetical protein